MNPGSANVSQDTLLLQMVGNEEQLMIPIQSECHVHGETESFCECSSWRDHFTITWSIPIRYPLDSGLCPTALNRSTCWPAESDTFPNVIGSAGTTVGE